MKVKKIKPLLQKYLLPNLLDFGFKGRLLLVEPVELILRGFCFESSGFTADLFYLTYFVMPTYMNKGYITFTFGDRLYNRFGGQGWDLEKETEVEAMEDVLQSMLKTGLPFIEKIKTPLDFAIYGSSKKESEDPHWWEPVAYSFILEGQQDKALEVIEHMERIYEDRKADVSFWYHDLIDRVRTVKVLLEKDPTEAVRQLLRWREQTLANLKLEEKAVKIEIP